MAKQHELFETPSDLLSGIAETELREAQYKEYNAKRRVASFGAGYDFDERELTPAPALDLEPRSAYVLRYSITFRTRKA